VTFGFQVPRVPSERPTDDRSARPYPALLEQWLTEANPGRTVEVVPLACPGYSSYQGLAWLRRDIARLDPDLVTACFGWNDIGRRNVTDAQAMPDGWLRVGARAVVFRSQALLGVQRRLGRWGLGRHGPAEGWQLTMRVPRDEYVSNMLAIARLSRDHGAQAVLLGPVYRDRHSHPPEGEDIAGHRAALAEAAAREGFAYLEFPELTEPAWPGNRPLFSEHIHPSDRGHRLMAEELLRFLAERGLLGDLVVPPSPERTRS
jgi:lysophospholipase L1-like esterase